MYMYYLCAMGSTKNPDQGVVIYYSLLPDPDQGVVIYYSLTQTHGLPLTTLLKHNVIMFQQCSLHK